MFGILEEEKAKNKRSTKMKTGSRRSREGGGGRGGKTRGRIRMDKVRRSRIMMVYLNMHQYRIHTPPRPLSNSRAFSTSRITVPRSPQRHRDTDSWVGDLGIDRWIYMYVHELASNLRAVGRKEREGFGFDAENGGEEEEEGLYGGVDRDKKMR